MRARLVWHQEGFLSLIKQILCIYKTYYIYEMRLNTSTGIPDIPCQVSNLTIKPLFIPITLAEYEQLGRKGCDFSARPDIQDYRKGDEGTIVFWTTANNDEFVNRTGMTTMRKGSVYEQIQRFCPSFVDDGHSAYAGFSETAIQHRLKGVYTYVHSKIYRYLSDEGFSRVVLLEGKEQVGPRKAQDKLGAQVLNKAWHLRLLYLFNFMWTKPKMNQ